MENLNRRQMLSALAVAPIAGLTVPQAVAHEDFKRCNIPPERPKGEWRCVINGMDVGFWIGYVNQFETQHRGRTIHIRLGELFVDHPYKLSNGLIILGSFIAQESQSDHGHGLHLSQPISALMRVMALVGPPQDTKVVYGDWEPFRYIPAWPQIGTDA